MGEISEEYEEVIQDIVMLGENEYLLDGGALVDDINEEMGLKLQTENYDTLSGYLIEQLGFIPEKGSHQKIESDGVEFIIEEVKGNRINKVKACLTGHKTP